MWRWRAGKRSDVHQQRALRRRLEVGRRASVSDCPTSAQTTTRIGLGSDIGKAKSLEQAVKSLAIPTTPAGQAPAAPGSEDAPDSRSAMISTMTGTKQPRRRRQSTSEAQTSLQQTLTHSRSSSGPYAPLPLPRMGKKHGKSG